MKFKTSMSILMFTGAIIIAVISNAEPIENSKFIFSDPMCVIDPSTGNMSINIDIQNMGKNRQLKLSVSSFKASDKFGNELKPDTAQFGKDVGRIWVLDKINSEDVKRLSIYYKQIPENVTELSVVEFRLTEIEGNKNDKINLRFENVQVIPPYDERAERNKLYLKAAEDILNSISK